MHPRGDDRDQGGPSPSLAAAPGEELRRLRQQRGMSLAGLSRLVHYTKGYLSRVETGEKPMTPEVARRCEDVLGAGGALTRLVPEPDGGRRTARGGLLEVCPYRGLAAFDAADAGWFFGRDRATAALVRQLTERLDDSGPTAVVAASGTGKTSLLRAGLVPELRRGVLPVPGSSRWPVVTMHPGEQPVGELLSRLAEATAADPDHFRRALAGGGAGALARAVHAALNRRPRQAGRRTGGTAPDGAAAPKRAVLVVDQFEEVFTLCPDARERADFVRAVHALATGPEPAGGRGGSAALVVLGMRADFYGRCLAFPELAAALRAGQLPLEPMRAQELRDAVVRPAQAVGLELEPGLAELILRDLGAGGDGPGENGGAGGGYEPGALPLLSHALLATWQRRRGRLLTVEGYQQAGGIAGAVAATAERAYGRLSPGCREAARAVLLQLVRVDQDGRSARRRVSQERLSQDLGAQAGAALEVVEAFTRARLLSVDADRVTLAHEAVLRAWPRLHGWIEADAAALHGLQQLGAAAGQWEAEGRDPALLPRGSRLAAAREVAGHPLAAVGRTERAFLEAATALAAAEHETERRRTLRLHRLLVSLAVLLVLTLAGGATAVHQSLRAEAERHVAHSQELAFRAVSGGAPRPEVAMLLATGAWRDAHTAAAASAVLSTQALPYAGRLTGHRERAFAVAWLPGGKRLLSAGADATVREWDARTHRQVAVTGNGAAVRALAAARVRGTVAWGDEAGAVTLRDRAGDSSAPLGLPRESRHRGPVRSVALSDGGELLASAGEDGTVRLTHLDGGRPRTEVRDPGLGLLYAVAVSGDGGQVAAAGRDGRVWLLHVPGGRAKVVGTREFGRVRALAFSPDGRRLATGEWQDRIGLWDTRTGRREASLDGPSDSVFGVAFSPDGKQLAAASQDDTAGIWDIAEHRRVAQLASHIGPVHGIAYSPDGRTLATSGEDGSVRLWTPQAAVTTPLPGSAWQDGALSPDRSLLAVAGRDGTVRLLHTADRGLRTVTAGQEPVRAVAFSPDGALFAAGDEHGTATVWRTADPRRPVHRWRAHDRAVTSVAFRPGDAGALATASEDHSAKVWRLAGSGALPEQSLLGHDDAVYRVLFLDRATLVTGSLDNTARIWRLSDGRELRRLAEHEDTVLGLAAGPHGMLATASRDHTVKLWDPAGRGSLRTLAGHTGPVTSVAFNPAGTRLVSTGRDNTVRIWDPGTGRPLLTLTGHTGRVRSAAFLGDDGPVVSVAEDGTVRWWDLDVPGVLARTCRALGSATDRPLWERLLPDVPYAPGCP
ncbi:helix-turn-helix domain-containing protein [Streptomyces roseoverticillatus]|uniref:nSTAND1 domain-containing NTPase n=1 Tax=Streptomyces roseoverticillatus TaxID=66429 RepID=UPI0027E4FAE4|nr:helix-turn-helix domain-containing protein [Streptomyces roseoverticillatus]MCF3101241.1 helix-turn-helix domain-containing protein [Streptomyces roseoverticillatus]